MFKWRKLTQIDKLIDVMPVSPTELKKVSVKMLT